MAKLSTDPYKGVRDFYPEDMSIQKWMFGVLRKVVESYGYVEYSASPLEPAELYRAKSGEEIVNEQTYTFIDRGDREVTLRPEMTPTVARMVAGKRRELGTPIRWYSIPNLFRYEQPQKGRLREHYQLNADIFGLSGVEADVEIIKIAYDILISFGAKESDFIIKINDRRNKLKGLGEKNLSSEQSREIIRLLDKKDKISESEFKSKTEEILGEVLELNFEESEYSKIVLDKLKALGVGNILFSPTLARGFDYYTGTIFEIFDADPANKRSLFGGGRYDNLTELFDNESIPAVGFGMGDVTLQDFLASRNLIPDYKSTAHILIASIESKNSSDVMLLAERLRKTGLNVATDTSDKKLGDKIKSTLKLAVPYFIPVGDEEISTEKYKVKNLSTGEEKVLKQDEIPEYIRNHS